MNPFNRNTIHHLVQCVILMFGVSGPVQIIVASESAAVQWSTVRHAWGEDLSGSLQGAGGIGGLLSTRSTPAQDSPSPISDLPSSAQSAFMHYDSNGNIILLTDAQANESARYAYDAFGKTLTATGPAAKANRYRFSTKPMEEDSALMYYGYRYYDPVTGRWPSRDPIEEKGGLNLYAMTDNNMNSAFDVFGLATHGLCGVMYNCAYVNESADVCIYDCKITNVNDSYDTTGGFCTLILMGHAVGDIFRVYKPKSDCPSAGCRSPGYVYTQSINGLYYDAFMADPPGRTPFFRP